MIPSNLTNNWYGTIVTMRVSRQLCRPDDIVSAAAGSTPIASSFLICNDDGIDASGDTAAADGAEVTCCCSLFLLKLESGVGGGGGKATVSAIGSTVNRNEEVAPNMS